MSHGKVRPEDIDETITALHGALKRTWFSFCASSTIHGLKYTRDEDTNHIVRFIWILISIVMFICAIVMMYTFYIDYQSNPTRMNVENDFAPVANLYFPPVTICPEMLFDLQKSRKYISRLKLPNNANVQDVIDHLHIYNGFMVDDERFDSLEIGFMESVLELNNLTLEQFTIELRWNCEDLLFRCYLYNAVEDCSQLFQISSTFFGYCCSFNLIQTGLNFTARYAVGGLTNGLSIILRYNDNSSNFGESYSQGFKLLMQETNAFPSAHAVAKFVALNTEVFLSIRTEETFSSAAVKALSIEERRCALPHEFPLTYFPIFISPHCELNCRIANMVKFCGCHTYFFNLNRTNDSICSFRHIPCLVDNFASIITRLRETQCYCPNPCEYFDYDIQVSSATLQLNMPTINPFYDGILYNDAVAHIFMNSQVYRRVRHDLLSNMVTLVSNLGSAFSLFVGMSMLSVVEVIYYFTVILRKFYTEECRAREKLLFRKSPMMAFITLAEERN